MLGEILNGLILSKNLDKYFFDVTFPKASRFFVQCPCDLGPCLWVGKKMDLNMIIFCYAVHALIAT